MSRNEIAVVSESHDVPPGSRLANSEQELAEAMVDHFEAFYKQGVILERIKNDQEYKDAGFTSFDKYMNERMPLGIKKTLGYGLIRAKNIRHLLPTIDSAMAEKCVWTERAIRHLTHKDFKPADVKRLGKKIATQVKKGEPLTEKLVKSICDADRGVDRKKAKKKAAEVAATDTASETLRKMQSEVEDWLMSLGVVPSNFWEEAESDDPGCTKEFISALSELASFLRG